MGEKIVNQDEEMGEESSAEGDLSSDTDELTDSG